MTRSGKDRRPPPDAANVLYNVTVAPEWGTFEFVFSKRRIPELTWDEANQAAEDLAAVINNFFLVNAVAEEDVFGNTRYGDDIARFAGWHDDEPTDRTVETPLVDPLIYSTEVVLYLQRTFLAARPLWRIRVCSSMPDRAADEARRFDLMIYPDAVWVGRERCPPADLAQEMSKWCSFHHDIREETRGPKRRQFLCARSKARELLPMMDESPVVFVVAFDNCEGSRDLHPVWVMHWGAFFDYITTRDDAMRGDDFAIRPDGTTRPTCLDEGAHVLTEWILPATGPHTLTIRRVTDAREWTIVVPDDQVLSDEMLRRMGYS